jgi:hypothetical protein
MSLRDEIAKRRAAEGWKPNPYYATSERVASLRVEDSDGVIWMLPWHHFTFGHHREAGERERLVLTFVAHEVALRGLNLTELIPEVVNQSIEWLRALPGKYVKSAGDEPSIEQIKVRPLAEPVVTE